MKSDARIKENEEVQQLIKKLEEQERKKNKDETGYFETNDERIARETREKFSKQAKEKEKLDKKTEQERKKNKEQIAKSIQVDADKLTKKERRKSVQD